MRFILCCLLLLWPARSVHAQDAWLGRDKALHFGISLALGAGGYGAAAPLVEPRWARASLGGGFALTVGGAKELWDRKHGDPSWRDFSWDAAGSAVGVGIAYLLDLAISRARRPRAQLRSSRLEIARERTAE